MSEVSQVKIGLLSDMMKLVDLNDSDVKKLRDKMSSYPNFQTWSQEGLDFVTLIKAFRFELSRRSPRRQVLTRIIQLYNTKLTRFNWESAMRLVGGE